MILVTGGAGFIGSHLADGLIERGYAVRVFDNLDPQVHGAEQRVPRYLNADAQFVYGDTRDIDALEKALDGVQAVFHQAALVGVSQSMYEIRRYIDHNSLGTANLLQLLASGRHDVGKLVVASSMSVYGEGKYSCKQCGNVYPRLRTEQQLQQRLWEMLCPTCSMELTAVPTDETKPLFPTSVYAVSKRDQEELSLTVGRAYEIPTVVLRYFNTYGTRQALSNPYTGVAAIFSSRILNGNPPLIFEDGMQSRDPTHVKDIVQANLLVLENSDADYRVFNVGTGKRNTILEMARVLLEHLGRSDLQPQIVRRYRAGDIRHCYADISEIQKLGYTPQVGLEEGIGELVQWVKDQPSVVDRVALAMGELDQHGLVK